MKGMKIGNIRLKNQLFLAPMVDVTDLPYRLICKKAGAAIAYTEMLNIGAILHENEKTLRMLKTARVEKPVGIQITGRNVKEFKAVSGRDELKSFGVVDINCGCPSSRITGNESGSYLLKTPKKIGEMVKILKKDHEVVTAKIRLGYEKNNVMKISKEIEKAGADLLTIHARLAWQRNKHTPDWKWIGKVKREIGIPVVGNGGVVDGESAGRMLDICDGVMIAGAAIGNPLVFREVNRYLLSGKEREIGWKDNLKEFLKYIKLAKKYDLVELPRMKYLGGNFLKGFNGAAAARMKFVRLNDVGEMEGFVKGLL